MGYYEYINFYLFLNVLVVLRYIYGKKKYVTAFTPRLSFKQENMDFFFEVYPDGRLISLIRDPRNWFPSALRHGPKLYGDIKLAILQWNESAQAMLRNKELYGDRIRLLKFEDLVGDTEAVMRYLSKFLDIEFEDILVVPTFNKSSIPLMFCILI